MASMTSTRTLVDIVVGWAEHIAFVVVGFVLIVVGLGLGVTIMMLPLGLVIGLIGLAMFVGGLTVRIGKN